MLQLPRTNTYYRLTTQLLRSCPGSYLTLYMSNTVCILQEAGTAYASHMGSPRVFVCGPCCSSIQFLVLSYYVSLRSEFRMTCVCAQWCLTHIALCFCFVFLRLVYPMLPVSLDCPFFIAPSIFSNVYFNRPISDEHT